ncbi:hypothetical protein LP420_23335 [Massilia sp. B-10]|nr:hypothetical protein LP420_23335 [Massilia sp. B-10]
MTKQVLDQEMRNKVGQLFMVGFDALEPDAHITRLIMEQRIGGVILFRRNVHTPSPGGRAVPQPARDQRAYPAIRS